MKTNPATKTAAISDYLAGNGGYKKIADRYGITPQVLISWVKNQERALSVQKISRKKLPDEYSLIIQKSFRYVNA